MRHKGYAVSSKAGHPCGYWRTFALLGEWGLGKKPQNGEELAMDIFTPQTVLPTQLQDRPNKEVWAGSRQLWWAVTQGGQRRIKIRGGLL